MVLQNTEKLLNNRVNPSRRESISDEIYSGLNNYILFQNNPDFRWPLWVRDILNPVSRNYGIVGSPMLTNNNLREWQIFNNYISNSNIRVDRSGMITASGDQNWAIEFWILDSENEFFDFKQENLRPELDGKTGELSLNCDCSGLKYTISFCGARSKVNEVIVNFKLHSLPGSKKYRLVTAIRPYCNLRLGGINSLEYISTEKLVSVNGNRQFGFCSAPDAVYTGTSGMGDISFDDEVATDRVSCNSGLATMGLAYSLNHESEFTFRLSLDSSDSLGEGTVNYKKCLKEFVDFSSHRTEEGIKLHFNDREFTGLFERSRIRLLGIPENFFKGEGVSDFRNLYSLVYAFNRAGYFKKSEKVLSEKIKTLIINKKKPAFHESIRGAFLILSYYDLYVHKRDSSFLGENFKRIREIGEAVYAYSSVKHRVEDFPSESMPGKFTAVATGYECLVFQLAMERLSGLSRWMGIFGDETKYSNESMRLQSICRDFFNERFEKGQSYSEFYALLAFPEKAMSNMDDELYNKFLSLFYAHSFPVINDLMGIDLYASLTVLNQLILVKSDIVPDLKRKVLSLFDEFLLTPEYMHPLKSRGCNGNGNSPVIASLIFVIMKNLLFFEYEDKIELLPFPEKNWFKPGKSIKVTDGSSRFGNICFTIETHDKEIKLILDDSPKYIPSEIKINFPLDVDIIETDEFIVKKKIGNTFFLNGWPSVIRFPIKGS